MRENDFLRLVRELAQADTASTADVLGIGDDGCLWTPGGQTTLSVDGIVEGRHFASDTEPELVGRKAAGAALSDLAAMAAVPRGAVVSLHCPERWDSERLMRGLHHELRRHRCPLLGGDTTGASELVISVTVWGEAGPSGRLLRRDQAQVGDLLVITGALGGSFASGRHLRPEPRIEQGLWLAEQPAVHALMDLSDGLATDAPRMAQASGLGCILTPSKVPVHGDVPMHSDVVKASFCDGEDFEILAAIDPAAWPLVSSSWPFDDVMLSIAGWLTDDGAMLIEDDGGRLRPMPWGGFEHAF